ncbi:MAG: mechanosensitive ion channel family protein [Cyclobacteriaceae bacterium]|nr:mechanosensitive ion channel family protein [Cyclobacteriaceae bacterium]MDH4296038.1 mechanosensitive ion channel family protein [Cyclobacteriaceae bacterium]MDH5249806.1 mechanosensitive ion channel family protein [Cyclobacteriaceae bacterium]
MERLLNNLNIPAQWHQLIVLSLCIVVIWALSWFLKHQISRGNLVNEIKYKANKAVTFGSYVVFLITVIVIYSASLQGFTVALGVAGAGIAFALQEVIASFAGWLALLFGNFYKPGDRVQLGGTRGDVIDIGVLRTTLMETGEWVDGDLYSGRIVRIANSFVFKEPVFNYSSDFPFLWDEITVPVHHGSDFEMARKAFDEAVNEVTGDFSKEAAGTWRMMTKKYRIENAQTAPFVTLTVNDNWIEFTIRYVVDYKRRRITKDQLFTNILNKVNQSAGRIALASGTIEIAGLPPVAISIKDRAHE